MKSFLKAEELFFNVSFPIVKYCPLTAVETRINAMQNNRKL